MPDTTVILDGLLRQLRDGSDAARRELLARAYCRLEVLARGKVRGFPGAGETGDVLHDVLIKLDRALQTARPDTPRGFFALASWHTRRVLIDLAGRRRLGGDPADPADDAAGPATVAEGADLHARLHEAVEALPADLRDVTDLLHYQGLTVAEAAGVLGVSDRTVKKRWRDARLALHSALGGDDTAGAVPDPLGGSGGTP